MHIYRPPAVPKTIPVVDLAPSFSGDASDFDRVAYEIHKACREMGFFYVSNHGVARDLIDGAFGMSRAFFESPLPLKTALDMRNSASSSGYESGMQQLDSQTADAEKAPPDLKESFGFGMDLPDDHPWALKRTRNYGHVQWPGHLPGFRETMLAYQAAMAALNRHLMALIARSLGLPADWFVEPFEMAARSIRLLRYPPHPDRARYNQLGAGAHTDWGAVTILAQDGAGGLEVRNADGDWVEARPIEDTFVINLGDLMARWSNGIYNANMHRVLNNRSGRDRYSMVSFNGPRHDVVIDPLPGCVTPDFPRKFATCTAQEHVFEMFRRSYGYAPGAVSPAA